mmetsp:Transcript_15992/g.30934  ORF Transcript_15992/g.30934 Transcript_15992/m.30934 type:complete len:967 (+) Transcript_15992:434-3334(+)
MLAWQIVKSSIPLSETSFSRSAQVQIRKLASKSNTNHDRASQGLEKTKKVLANAKRSQPSNRRTRTRSTAAVGSWLADTNTAEPKAQNVRKTNPTIINVTKLQDGSESRPRSQVVSKDHELHEAIRPEHISLPRPRSPSKSAMSQMKAKNRMRRAVRVQKIKKSPLTSHLAEGVVDDLEMMESEFLDAETNASMTRSNQTQDGFGDYVAVSNKTQLGPSVENNQSADQSTSCFDRPPHSIKVNNTKPTEFQTPGRGQTTESIARRSFNEEQTRNEELLRSWKEHAQQRKTAPIPAPAGGLLSRLGNVNISAQDQSEVLSENNSRAHQRATKEQNFMRERRALISSCEEILASSRDRLFATASHNASALYAMMQKRVEAKSEWDQNAGGRFNMRELAVLMETYKAIHAALPAAERDSRILGDGQLAARLFPSVVSEFPVAILFEGLMMVGWWGTAQELIYFMINSVHKSTAPPPQYPTVLLNMLSACSQIGSDAPVDKDAVPTALMLLDILRDEDAKRAKKDRNQNASLKYLLCMRLFVRQFDRYQDPSLLHHVLHLFEEMQSLGIPPSPSIWMRVIHAYGKLGDLDSVNKTLEAIQRSKSVPHRLITGSVVEMYCYNNDLERAEQILANMIHSVPWEPGVNYNQPLWEWLLNKFRGYSATGLVEDPTLYGPAASGQNPSDTEDTSERPRLMSGPVVPTGSTSEKLRWPPPDAFLYNVLLHAYVAKGDIDKVHALYTDMKARGIMTDSGTASIIAEAFAGSPYGAELLRIEHPHLVPEPREYIDNRNLLTDGVLGPRTDGKSIFTNKLDLHGCSRAKTQIALLAYLEALSNAQIEYKRLLNEARADDNVVPERASLEVSSEQLGLEPDPVFIIVTGRGIGDRRSNRRGPILREQVRKILEEQGVPHFSPPGNSGRICIHVSDLEHFSNRRQKMMRNLESTYKVSSSIALILIGLSSFSAIPALFKYF